MPPALKAILNIVASHTCTASIIASLSVAFLFTSCGGSTGQQEKQPVDSLIALPPGTLSEAETEKYRIACKAWYDTSLKANGFNGGIIVAKKGSIVFEDYVGSAHLNGTDTINASTPFHIASVSKTFTAMAVLKLAQEHKLDIDDELVKYFEAFNYPGVTIRTLLNHRSGLPNYVYFFEKLNWDKEKYVLNEDVLDYVINKKAMLKDITTPNTRFSYCNTNYALLALLIEKVSGLKYPSYLQQAFFKPLQMQNTFVYDTTLSANVSPSYDWKGELIPWNFLDAVYGDKNIYSTPKDLLIWDKALNCCKIFTDSTLSEAYLPYSNERPGIRNYGLGWRMNVYPNGKKMIYHNGWWHGNNATFIRLLQDSATIIVVGNKFNRNIYHAREMAQIFGDYGSGVDEEEDGMRNTKTVPDTLMKNKKAK